MGKLTRGMEKEEKVISNSIEMKLKPDKSRFFFVGEERRTSDKLSVRRL